MRLPESAHSEHPWRIHEIAPDFVVEDVWKFRTPGAGRHDFPALLAAIQAERTTESTGLSALLFKVRWKLGELFGWDRAQVTSLRDRLPTDLRDTATPVENSPLTSLYILDNEYAGEIANSTMHGIMHLSWVPDPTGYHLRMAVLVKPNGHLGRLYMAAIKPFRYTIIYPAITRSWEQTWKDLAIPH
ncbi:DUF2867 domain-containing protein [Nocardia sp. NPDC058666]|uniref:DUF2867 domain-containing protein n=1 Tax=Nocardia sp. NPDC058666 TaxID=3346587 RepID=UPI0036584FD1